MTEINALGFDFQNFGEMLKAMWNGLCSVLAPVFEGVFQHISDIFTFMTDIILSVLDVFISLFFGKLGTVLERYQRHFYRYLVLCNQLIQQYSEYTESGGRCIS